MIPLSRRAFVAVAAGGAATLAAGCGEEEREPRENPSRGDLDVVNYALTLEYLEEDYYEQVVRAGVLSGREAELTEAVRDNEREHVVALRAVAEDLGGPVAEPPATDFSEVLAGGRDAVIEVAAALENTGAGAYLAEADQITDREILASALAIHTVEGRHAAIFNLLAGRPPLPQGAFAQALGRGDVMRRIARFLA